MESEKGMLWNSYDMEHKTTDKDDEHVKRMIAGIRSMPRVANILYLCRKQESIADRGDATAKHQADNDSTNSAISE